MARFIGGLLARALLGAATGVFVIIGGLTATAYASGSGPGGGSTAGPPSDAAQAQSQSAAGGGSSTGFNGNKGHVQIEGAPDCGTTPCGNDNDPHPGCTLTLQLFGYPSGTNSAGVVIAGQAPSGTGRALTDSFRFPGNTGGPNGSTLDFEKTYSVTTLQLAAAGLKSQAQQGYHLRIDVSVNGNPAKSKVIWYGCPVGSPSPGLVHQSGTPQEQIPGGPSARPDSSAQTTLAGSSPGSGGFDTAALPDTPAGKPLLSADTPAALTSAAPARPSADSSGFLAFTGWDLLLALAVAGSAGAAGLGLVKLSRKRRLA
jgi:hypothetical protein